MTTPGDHLLVLSDHGFCRARGDFFVNRWLEERGASALVLSGGFVSRDAFYLFRGDRPLRQMIEVEKSRAQRIALRPDVYW